MKPVLFLFLFLLPFFASAQEPIETIDAINLESIPPHTVKKYWLKMIDNGLSQPVCIPVIIAKGSSTHPVLGMTAALHGNELNGIGVIQRVFDDLKVDSLKGTVIGIPGLNAISLLLDQRRFIDEEDLNRNFPGKENGNESQQYVWQITQKVLPLFDYLIDMHTASFGRINTLYVRADMSDEAIKTMALLQDADIVLQNKGVPSAEEKLAATRSMRAEAMLQGTPTITIEYGDPQVYQADLIERGKQGVENVLHWLKIIPQGAIVETKAIICKKSYWLFVDKGGYLEVLPQLQQQVLKGEKIAILRNPFGDIIQEYFCPEDGIVIGKSSNPINMNGGRILHLGILAD